MTKEEYNKIVEPVAPFEEIEKKQPMSIVEFIEEVGGRELNEWQKEFITNKYRFYKANPNGRLIARGSAKTDIEPWLAFMFDIYEEEKKK